MLARKRESETYIIVSCITLGIEDNIANVFAKIADYYKAKVICLGPTATPGERRGATRDGITKSEAERVNKIRRIFGPETLFVTTKDTSTLPESKTVVHGGMSLGKYLYLSPVMPSGERSINPLTKRARTYLKGCGKNWMVPHPVPSVESLPKPGLNEAYNYWSVGCLRTPEHPTTTNNQHKSSYMPCAVMVVVDSKNEEFFARHLHIDYIGGRPAVLDDGLVFMEGQRVFEVKTKDRASVATDGHAPYFHPGTVGVIRHLNSIHEPGAYIDLGDACDFSSVCRHNKGRPGAQEGLRLSKDLEALAFFLEICSEHPTIKERVLIDSNHHDWLTDFVEENPALKGMLDWDSISKQPAFSKWNILRRGAGENNIYYFGDFALRHGDQEGNLIKAEGLFPKGKYACGHWHRFHSYRRAVVIACASLLGPGYLENRISAWQSQVASLTKFKGVASISPKIVLHDKKRPVSRYCYRNTIYEVDFFNKKQNSKPNTTKGKPT